jgi:hypothetical protein
MKILIACEYSGRVREAFRAKGHEAWSCDLIASEDNSRFHIQGDVLEILKDGWDMMIAHPPCTYLASSGLHWNKRKPGRDELTHEAMLFVLNLMGEGSIAHGIPKIALENPIGRISTAYRKPDQTIQPYNFGEDASKSTCLWLKGLPLLRHTKFVEPRVVDGKNRWGNQCDSGQNKLGPSDDRWKERSRTYQGIANAMAEQWG